MLTAPAEMVKEFDEFHTNLRVLPEVLNRVLNRDRRSKVGQRPDEHPKEPCVPRRKPIVLRRSDRPDQTRVSVNTLIVVNMKEPSDRPQQGSLIGACFAGR